MDMFYFVAGFEAAEYTEDHQVFLGIPMDSNLCFNSRHINNLC